MNQKELPTQIFLSLLALLIVAGIGLYASLAQNQLPVQPSDETAGWQTYRNEEYGFEFRYPPTWELVQSDNFGIALISPERSRLLDSSQGEGDIPPEITVSIVFNHEGDDINNFASYYGAPGLGEGDGWFTTYTSRTTDVVGGHNTIRFSDAGSLVGHAPVEAVFIQGDERLSFLILFTLNDYGSPEYPEKLFILNQILSTLTFTEPSSGIDTSTWQTYQDAGHGFSIQFPRTWGLRTENQFYFLGEYPPSGNYNILNLSFGRTLYCDKIIGKVRVGTKSVDKCFDGEPEDRWVAHVVTPPGNDVGIYCWFPITLSNERMCNEVLATLTFIDIADLADWQIYRNKELGFEAKHPTEWSVDTKPEYGIVTFRLPDQSDTTTKGGEPIISSTNINIAFSDEVRRYNNVDEAFAEFKREREEANKTSLWNYGDFKLVEINGTTFFTYRWMHQISATVFVTVRNSKLLTIMYSDNGDGNSYETFYDLFSKFISTFKFTN